MDRMLVVQLGRTGLSFVRHYRASGCEVEVADARAAPAEAAALARGHPGVAIRRLASYQEIAGIAAGYDEIAVSPGVPPAALPPGLETVGDLDCFLTAFRARWPQERNRPLLIAVTGTNGKSTVAELAARLLCAAGRRAAAVGNIGYPLLDAYHDWQAGGWPDCVVAELSSFQLARLRQPLGADVACLLNCVSDHLDWHGGFAAYRAAKAKVFSGASIGVYSHDDPAAAAEAGQARAAASFGAEGTAACAGWMVNCAAIVKRGAPRGIPQDGLRRRGIMPLSACAALTIADHAAPELDLEEAAALLESSQGLPHRFRLLADELDGLRFIDDSKSTNVAAAAAALGAIDGTCVLLAGGEDKGQDFGPLMDAVRAKAAAVIVIDGEDCRLAQALRAHGVRPRHFPAMDEAVAAAAAAARELGAGTVLLSPACSSHDRYADFAARGAAFGAAVARLCGAAGEGHV